MKKYLKRHIDKELEIWAKSQERKPLLLRGARQVGKTSAVRHLAEEFEYFAEVDFNERPDIHYMFNGTYSTQEICQLLSIQLHTPIIAGKKYRHAQKPLIAYDIFMRNILSYISLQQVHC